MRLDTRPGQRGRSRRCLLRSRLLLVAFFLTAADCMLRSRLFSPLRPLSELLPLSSLFVLPHPEHQHTEHALESQGEGFEHFLFNT